MFVPGTVRSLSPVDEEEVLMIVVAGGADLCDEATVLLGPAGEAAFGAWGALELLGDDDPECAAGVALRARHVIARGRGLHDTAAQGLRELTTGVGEEEAVLL